MRETETALFNTDDVLVVDAALIERLKRRARETPTRRFRICLFDDHPLAENAIKLLGHLFFFFITASGLFTSLLPSDFFSMARGTASNREAPTHVQSLPNQPCAYE